MYVTTICLYDSGHENNDNNKNSVNEFDTLLILNWTEFDTPATLKHNEGHQTWYKLVDTRQGYNHAKFERLSLNSLVIKPTIMFLLKETRQLFPLSMCESIK